MIKKKSKLISTYSRRKQFRRVVKDNWNEYENVFNSSSEHKLANHLTSTPIGNNKAAVRVPVKVTPLNLFNSGSFDTPIEDRAPLQSIKHPRLVQGKRACRQSPELCSKPQDSQTDLFADSVEFSAKHSSLPKDGKDVIITKSESDSSIEIIAPWNLQSRINQNLNDDDSSNVLSVNCTQISQSSNYTTSNVSLPEIKYVPAKDTNYDDSFFKLSNCSSQLHVQNASELKNSGIICEIQDLDDQLDPILELEHLEKSPENELVDDVSKMSIGEPPDNNDVSKISNNNDVSKMSVQEEASVHHVSQMELSIDECVYEGKIAVLNRSLMLATTVPAYKKLLSQCRRERDLLSLIQDDKECIKKIGEGTFGEVFLGKDTVYKVLPVGGSVEMNGVEQTSFENAFQEIVVSKKLSELAGDEVQMGKAFCQLKGVVFCVGPYPAVLLNAWDDFKNTENDRPDRLPADQMYVVLLAKYSGTQLEDYCTQHKLTPDQAHSVIRQICCSLAAAEQKFQFEHRDLHWGNVLIADTTKSHVEFTQDGKTFILKSHGLLATIIDFTFSRLETEGCLNFVDLEQEEWLFQGDVKVDIQYRVYRDMRSACRKNWAKYTPRTNVLWLLYLIDKMNLKIKSQKLRRLKQSLSSYKSATTALAMAFRSL